MLYYAEVADDKKPARGGGVEQEGEDIEVIEMSLEDLDRVVSGGAIQDAKALVGIQWLRL
jgi:GDP-mannose pyrophosphatase NudK